MVSGMIHMQEDVFIGVSHVCDENGWMLGTDLTCVFTALGQRWRIPDPRHVRSLQKEKLTATLFSFVPLALRLVLG